MISKTKKILCRIHLLTLLAFGILAPQNVEAAVNIPLTFSSSFNTYYISEFGIPFPRGVLGSLDNLRVEDSNHIEVAAQFQGLAKWPDGSFKSVLILMNADPSKAYTLRYGSDIRHSTFSSGLSYQEDTQTITVTTGLFRVAFNKSKFGFFDQVWVDSNRNRIYEDTEKILSGPGDIFLKDAFDGTQYLSSLSKPTYKLEENGPVRLVLKVTGKLQSSDGRTLTDYIVRFYFYNYRGFAKVDYTLVDTRDEKDVNATRSQLALSISSYGLRLPLKLTGTNYSFGGESDQVYSGPLTQNVSLYQSGAMNYVDGSLQPFSFNYSGVGTGAKAPGWFDVRGKTLGVSIALKDFWQQFPKEFGVENNQMVVYLHPAKASQPAPNLSYPPLDSTTKRYVRPNTFYFPREGGAKTYQMFFWFHPGRLTNYNMPVMNQAFQANPRLTAPASWYAASGAFGNLLEAGPWSQGYDYSLLNDIYKRSIGDVKATGSLAMLYGWRDYGDRMRPGWTDTRNNVRIPSFYNDTHVGAHNFIIQYVRTLDNRWWELGEITSRHWMDIDVSHSNRTGYWGKSFGPGEGLMISHDMQDHSARNIHLGHAHLSGLGDYYLLTGDKRALEVITEVGTWWKNSATYFYPTPLPSPHYAEAERDFGWPLWTLCEVYRATGDVSYFQAAAQVVKHLIEWWKTPSDHYVNGAVVGRNDWQSGTGWWAMYPRMDNSPSPPAGKILYNGTNPWMAGFLLNALIEFYEINKDYNLADNPTIKEMMLQTLNYVVKYGYDETKKYKPYSYFVYSEAVHDTDGGSGSLMTPMAYLGRIYAKEKLAHPEWYNTAPKWLSLAKARYLDAKVIKARDTTSLGFYGYEMMHLSDFWKIMKALEDDGTLNRVP